MQTSFEILRLSASTRSAFLLRNFQPIITKRAAEDFDGPLDWVLVVIIAKLGLTIV